MGAAHVSSGLLGRGPSVKPEDIDTVEKARLYAVEHDAKVWGLWGNQHRYNEKNTKDHQEIKDRLAVMEKRIIYAMGFVAAVVAFASFVGMK